MWRRPQTQAVPSYHPQDGADLHAHSPRRRGQARKTGSAPRWSGSLHPGLSLSHTFGPPANPGVISDLSFAPRSANSSNSSFPDLMCDAMYSEWVNQLTNCNPAGEIGRTWPSRFHDKGQQSSSDTSMPDLFPPNSGQNPWEDFMHISGPSLEDDAVTSNMHLKVPTNTPTSGGLPVGSSCGKITKSISIDEEEPCANQA